MGGPGRAPDHIARQRGGDAGRRRGRQHAGADIHHGGAFSDLTDLLPELGGDDLLQGFVDAGSVDGQTYAVPYYAGSKYVFYGRTCSRRPA